MASVFVILTNKLLKESQCSTLEFLIRFLSDKTFLEDGATSRVQSFLEQVNFSSQLVLMISAQP